MSQNNLVHRTQELRRVVVTGMGALTPLGNNVKDSWQNCINGKSGIGMTQAFDTEKFDSKISGEVRNFDPETIVSKKDQRKMDRFIVLSLEATRQAIEDSGIEFTDELKKRTGTIVGVGIGGLPMIESQHGVLFDKGPRRISPFFIPAVLTNMAAGQISIKYGFGAANYTVTSACASGSHSIGEAANMIRQGTADVMFAGGSEGAVSEMAVAGFGNMKALSTRNDAPEAASRPWDKDRDGFVIAEGAATLCLESLEHAQKRGAKIYAEVLGYGFSSDAHHMTTPSPGGAGAARAMKNAIDDAMINPDQVEYVNAHGTSTPAGDEIESNAVKLVMGDAAKNVWISSTKSMTGHTLGAAGAIEGMFSVLSLAEGVIPPTINLENPSEDCDLDYVPLTAREKQMKYVMNNSFGFGGTNSSLIFSKFQ